VQQCPVPVTPQMVEVHEALLEQEAPAGSPPVPVVVPPVEAVVVAPAVAVPPVVPPPVVVPPSTVVEEPHPAANSPANPSPIRSVRMRVPLRKECMRTSDYKVRRPIWTLSETSTRGETDPPVLDVE
jgi:hypothetical protein